MQQQQYFPLWRPLYSAHFAKLDQAQRKKKDYGEDVKHPACPISRTRLAHAFCPTPPVTPLLARKP
jgi:hypothetical protein